MAFDRDKFKALVHYVCWRCAGDPSKLGATKLNKVLWLSDFISYYRSGAAMTGARYVKRQFGPVPRAIVPVLAELEQEGSITVRRVQFHGYEKKEYVVAHPPDMGLLQEQERTLVDGMVGFVCDRNTARTISDLSHDHIWKAAEDGEEIPYFTVFATPEEITEDDRAWALAEIEAVPA
jgi:hypothetical protein